MTLESPLTLRAHSSGPDGRPHLLKRHSNDTAESARAFAAPFGGGALAHYVGFRHDIGKAHDDFQRYLDEEARKRGPDHSSAGMVLAVEQGFEAVAALIAGHHGGLPDEQDLKERIRLKRKDPAVRAALDRAGERFGGLDPTVRFPECVPQWLPLEGLDAARTQEMFLRFVFSALVDADFLDTEAHFNPGTAAARDSGPKLALLEERFAAYHREHVLPKADTSNLNRLRHEMYQHCLAAAGKRPGLFRLTMPTGGGKTLSSMAFALRHARTHGLRRVVVGIPYTSIIDQTAKEYRKIFPAEVLEHHSAVAPPTKKEENPSPVTREQLWSRLAAENWDARIVVTTTVQLFESLYANRPAKCRKLHRLAGSVLILDEVQTLPPELLEPITDGLRELTEHYGTTVVLCTATQPALSEGLYASFFEGAEEIVPEAARYFRELRRVTYHQPPEPWTWERVSREIANEKQCLTIVNTKRDALALLDRLTVVTKLEKGCVLHLSTNLCGAHRRRVLEEVERRLTENERCLLVSTQVVEAGVDLDFPVVLRARGPLDRIVQAAGRCNREGVLGIGGGRVVIFEPADAGPPPPGAYRTAMGEARAMLAAGYDLADPGSYTEYFQRLYSNVDLDQKGIQPARAGHNFRTVAEEFRLIDDDTLPLVVLDPEDRGKVEALLARVRSIGEMPRELFRELQPYVVNVRRRVAEHHVRAGWIEPVAQGLFRWWGGYDKVRGLTEEPGLSPEELVV